MLEALPRRRRLRAFLRTPSRFGWLAALLLLALAFLLHFWTAIQVLAPTVRTPLAQEKPITFPYRDPGGAGQLMEFAFTIHRGPLTQRSIAFVPDDHFVSLSVNGQDIPLDGVDPKERDDYERGFRFPIGSYLRRGDNAVVARVLDRGGPGGLDVSSDPNDWVNRLEILAGLSAFLVLFATALRRFEVPWGVTLLFAAGVAARFAYLSVTPPELRSHDMGGRGHLAYIEYVLDHTSIPSPYDGWSFYQPPLYYVLAAGLWKVLVVAGIRSREFILWALQVQSLLYQVGFLAFSLGTGSLWLGRLPDTVFGRRLASRSGLYALFAALLCLWPSAVIHSVRIGNDDMFYLWFGGGLYFASRWWVTDRDRDLHLAALFGALGVLTKSNSLLLFVLLGVLLAARFALDRARRFARLLLRAWPSVVLFLLSTGFALGRAALDTARGKRSSILVGNVTSLGGELAVGNRAANYLWFDMTTFVTRPFTDPCDDAKGRQFFWNYELKTSLFGEFSFNHPRLADLAVVLSLLLLFVVACVLLRVALSRREDLLSELPALVAVATLVSGLAALRMSIPMSCSGDFRYVLPLLTPCLYLYVRSLALFRERGWTRLAGAGTLAGWSFAVCSALFFVIVTATG